MRLLPVSLLLVSLGSAQATVKLNGELAHHPGGGVGQYQLSADGTHCVYLADQDEYERHDLYGVPTDGSAAPVRLTAALPLGSELYHTFALSADGSRVVFLLDRFDTGNELALYAVPAGANEPLIGLADELAADFLAGFPLCITSDGTRALYRESVLELRLSSVPTDGSAAPTVLFSGAPVTHFQLSPDETHVVFSVGEPASGLWQAPLDGASAAILLHGLPADHGVTGLVFTPDQQRVVYLAGPSGGPHELWSQSFDGVGSPQRLNAPLAPGGSVEEFELTRDGELLLYRADQDADEAFELFLASARDPDTSVKLVAAAPERDVTRFALLPDGRGVAFLADLAVDDVVEAWLVPLTPGAPARRLNEPLTAGGDVLELAVTSDASHVVYRADARLDGRAELWSVPLTKARRLDPRAVLLNPPLAPGAGVERFFFDAARRRVVFATDPDGPLGSFDLTYLSAPYSGGASVELGLQRPGTFVPRPAGNGRLLANGRLQHAFGGFRLFSVPSDGSLAPSDLSGPTAPGPWVGEVYPDVAVSPDGVQAFYRADQGPYDAAELFRVPSDGSAPAVALNTELPINGVVSGYRLSPDGAYAAFVAAQRVAGRLELFLTATDGSTAPLALHELVGPGFVMDDLCFTPDGTRLVHRAGPSFASQELFSVPADGSAPPVQLSGAMVAGGTALADHALAAAGARVVYRADESEDERIELWSAPVDGAAARLRLHAPLASTRDVLEFQVAPLGERVVFRGDLDAEEVVELYSVLASDSTPVRLNPALIPGGDVVHCAISPDGQTVAYVADQLVDNRFELFRVPIDGSAPALRLNGNLISGGDVATVHNTYELLFSPDSARVLYVADALANERFELFSVLTTGGTPPVRLNPQLGQTGDVGGALASWTSLALTLDGARVVFLANPSDAFRHLYVAPIDGATPAAVLLAPAPQANLDRLLLDDDGAHVLVTSRNFAGTRLLLVPLDGSFAPVDLSPAPTSTLEPFLVPGADRVLQLRDPDGPAELFSTGP
jgi:Tol biopolymer transport system component